MKRFTQSDCVKLEGAGTKNRNAVYTIRPFGEDG